MYPYNNWLSLEKLLFGRKSNQSFKNVFLIFLSFWVAVFVFLSIIRLNSSVRFIVNYLENRSGISHHVHKIRMLFRCHIPMKICLKIKISTLFYCYNLPFYTPNFFTSFSCGVQGKVAPISQKHLFQSHKGWILMKLETKKVNIRGKRRILSQSVEINGVILRGRRKLRNWQNQQNFRWKRWKDKGIKKKKFPPPLVYFGPSKTSRGHSASFLSGLPGGGFWFDEIERT